MEKCIDPNTVTPVNITTNIDWNSGLIIDNHQDIDRAENDIELTSLAKLENSMAKIGWEIIKTAAGNVVQQTYQHKDLKSLLIFTMWMQEDSINKLNINVESIASPNLATGIKPSEAIEIIEKETNSCLSDTVDDIDLEIVKLIGIQYSNLQMESSLSMPRSSIASRIRSIKRKLNLESRLDIQKYYLANMADIHSIDSKYIG